MEAMAITESIPGTLLQRVSDILWSNGFLLVIALMIVFFSVVAPHFLTVPNVMAMLHTMAPVVVAACGMALLVIAGKIDISIGSIALFTSSVGVFLLVRSGLSPFAAFGISILGGMFLGAVNGFIVTVLKINPLITTLGTMIGFRGLALQITHSNTIPLPDSVRLLGNLAIGPVFIDVIVAAAAVLTVHVLHQHTPFGRQLTAIGNGEEVARRLGIRTGPIIFAGFVLSGFLAAIGGIISVLQVGLLSTSVGRGMEFSAVAVVIVGGISLFGGRGALFPAIVVGAFVFELIANGLTHVGANPYAYRLISGALIFVAMYADALKTRARKVRTTTAASSTTR
jgi:ribose/xylose/arabinose/galactoside ABC-type transport system permease subunit